MTLLNNLVAVVARRQNFCNAVLLAFIVLGLTQVSSN